MADEKEPTVPPATAPAPAPAATEPTSEGGLAAPTSLVQRLGLSETLKKTFADYIETNHIRPEHGADLNVDLDFLKHHAGPLLVHLLKGATQSLLPRDLKFSVPAPPPSDAPSKEPVNLNFDLGDFLAKLFNPPDTNPPR
ncbi:MAG: hypothetical protein U1F43_32685 [Myxococcota bacterium]